MIGRMLAHYRIVAPIAAGGMGQVYRARDTHLERDVAIKVLPPELFTDPDARRRLRAEAISLSRLQHPHIAVVHDFAEDQGVPFLVMELIDGETLESRIDRGPLAEPDVRRLGTEIASALSAAHEQRVIHRDLKPANVMITARGAAKVLDFGIAKRIAGPDPRGTATTLTVTNALVGTVSHMAPEQLLGLPVDARTDVFALGVVLYEMVTGERPFQGDTPMALGNAILNESPQPPRARNPACSIGLETIILRCLEKAAEKRPGSAAEVGRAMADADAGFPRAVGPASRPPEHRAPRRVSRWIYAGLAVAALGVAGLAFVRPALRGWLESRSLRALAVLPLSNLSGDPEQEFLVDGMTDELIVTLSQIASLKVISRASSMSYKGTRKAAKEIARELGVAALVSGSVQRSGPRLRVRAQLVDASSDRSLWAGSFEREMTDVLTLQQEIALAIVEKVGARLAPEETARLARGRTLNPEAHEAYLRGRYYWHRYTAEDWDRALAHFQKAIELDSGYAAAYAGLADTYILQNGLVMDPKVLIPRARTAVRRALDLDPNLAAAHAALGYMQANFDFEWKAAEASYRRALQLNPNEVTAYQNYGFLLHVNGRFDEAASMFAKAREFDPLSTYAAIMSLWPLNQGRRYDEAIASARKLVAGDSSAVYARVVLGQALVFSGRTTEGIAELETVIRAERIALFRSWLGWAYARAGRTADAERILNDLLRQSRTGYVPPYGLAILCLGLGRNQEALDWLEAGIESGNEEVVFAHVDPAMDPVRPDPRFQSALRRLGFEPGPSPPEWKRTRR